MKLKTEHRITKSEFLIWKDSFSVGIDVIDDQHKKLINNANALYFACLQGNEAANNFFRHTVRKTMQYILLHFKCEEELFEKIGYPDKAEHKTQHELFIIEVLDQVTKFKSGARFVPNSFVRYLHDWILTHIAIQDKKFGLYYTKKIAEGSVIPREIDILLNQCKI